MNGNLNLSRAIGDLKYKSNNGLAAKDQIITAQPDIIQVGGMLACSPASLRRTQLTCLNVQVTITPEDRFFVLACDGVWDVMTNQDVVNFVGKRLGRHVPRW